MLSQLVVEHEFIDVEVTSRLLSFFEAKSLERGRFGFAPNVTLDFTRRVSYVHKVTDDDVNSPEVSDFFTKCKDFVTRKNDEVFFTELDGSYTALYEEFHGNERGFHSKHHSVNWFGDSNQAKIMLIVNLSSEQEFEGGEIKFQGGMGREANRVATRKQYTAYCFPCFRYYEILPVLSGKKKLISLFYKGPHWK